jgi:hypothetical protein
MTKPIVAFRNFAHALKNVELSNYTKLMHMRRGTTHSLILNLDT